MLDLAVRDGRLPRTPATGVRLPRAEKGEAAAVRVRRVDLMKRRIEVVHTAIELNGEMTYGTPKTHQRRSVPIPRSRRRLAEHVAGKAPDDLLSTTLRSDVMRNHNFRGAGVLGHASAAMTLDVYAGLFGDDLDAVAEEARVDVEG